MTLFTFSLGGSILSLVMMIVGWIWLYRRGKFEMSKMDKQEAVDFVQDGTVGDDDGIVIAKGFKGKAWGGSMATSIETREVVDMMKQGRWSEAAPWIMIISGALLAFLFWPMWILVLCGADLTVNILLTAVFFGTAIRAAWPRK